jgi:hypothetical protein
VAAEGETVAVSVTLVPVVTELVDAVNPVVVAVVPLDVVPAETVLFDPQPATKRAYSRESSPASFRDGAKTAGEEILPN